MDIYAPILLNAYTGFLIHAQQHVNININHNGVTINVNSDVNIEINADININGLHYEIHSKLLPDQVL